MARLRHRTAMIGMTAVIAMTSVLRAAPTDQATLWEQVRPASRTARLEVTDRVIVGAHDRLVALDAHGPVVDDELRAARVVGGNLHAAADGHGSPGSLVWARSHAIVALDTAGGLVVLEPNLDPGADSDVLRIRGALYYVAGSRLVRYDLAARRAAVVAPVGDGYAGALAISGTAVFVADREAVWAWDLVAGRKRVVSREVYWPTALAARGDRLLADHHGHGAWVLNRTGKLIAYLGSPLAWPSGAVAWSEDSALLVELHPTLQGDPTDPASIIPSDDDRAGAAISCWRTELGGDGRTARMRALYHTEVERTIAGFLASGDRLAWIEVAGDGRRELVVARLRGRCE